MIVIAKSKKNKEPEFKKSSKNAISNQVFLTNVKDSNSHDKLTNFLSKKIEPPNDQKFTNEDLEIQSHNMSKIGENDLIEEITRPPLDDKIETLNPFDQVIFSATPIKNYKKSFIELEINNCSNDVFSTIKKILENEENDIFTKIRDGEIKLQNEELNINQILEKENNKKTKRVNINGELRLQFLKETEGNINDINSRIKKIEEKIFIIENSDFSTTLQVKDENEYNNKQECYINSVEKNYNFLGMKEHLKQLQVDKINLQNKIIHLDQYKNGLQDQIKKNDISKPSEFYLDVKKYLENFDKDCATAEAKIKQLISDKKVFLKGIQKLKEKEKQRKERSIEKNKEIEESKKAKKKEEYLIQIQKLAQKNEQKKEELVQIKEELVSNKVEEKEVLFQKMERLFSEKQHSEKENLKISIINKKLELKKKLQRITTEEIDEFGKQIEEKLEALNSEKIEAFKRRLNEEKEKAENFKSKILEINCNSKYQQEEMNKLNEKIRKIEEKNERKNKLKSFISRLPLIIVNENKKQEVYERINTIHSSSLISKRNEQRSLMKSRIKHRSKSPRIMYSENLRTLVKNKSYNKKTFESQNKKQINSDIVSDINKGIKKNDFESSKFSLFSEYTSGMKRFLQPINTKINFPTSKLSSESSVYNSVTCKSNSNLSRFNYISKQKNINLPLIDRIEENEIKLDTNIYKEKKDKECGPNKLKEPIDILKLKADCLNTKIEQKEKLLKIKSNYLENYKEQEEYADAMLNGLKYKLNILNNFQSN